MATLLQYEGTEPTLSFPVCKVICLGANSDWKRVESSDECLRTMLAKWESWYMHVQIKCLILINQLITWRLRMNSWTDRIWNGGDWVNFSPLSWSHSTNNAWFYSCLLILFPLFSQTLSNLPACLINIAMLALLWPLWPHSSFFLKLCYWRSN